MIEYGQILEWILLECREDHVGLWSVLWHVRWAGILDESERMDTTLALVSELLSKDDIVAGQFEKIAEDKWVFHIWKMSPEEIVRRIKAEWIQLGHDPTLGDIVWFTTNTFDSTIIQHGQR